MSKINWVSFQSTGTHAVRSEQQALDVVKTIIICLHRVML